MEREKNPFRQNLLGSIRLFLVLGALSILKEAPEKENITTRGETLAKELNVERSDFVFARQPGAFRSGASSQWLSGDLKGEILSAHNH